MGYSIQTFLSFIFLSTAFGNVAHSQVKIANHLTYQETTCTLEDVSFELHEIQLQPQSNLEMQVIPNPEARVDSNCFGNYGGPGLASLVRRPGNSRVLAVTNGNFFRTQQKSKSKVGFVPTGLLWSRNASHRGKLYEKLRMKGGKDLLLINDQGAHRIRLNLESCGNQTCATLAQSHGLKTNQISFFTKKMRTEKLLKALETAFPKMTLVAQQTMDLTGGKLGKNGKFEHFSECPAKSSDQNTSKDDDRKAYWKCRKVPRTILCGRRDGSVSLMITPSAYVYDLARGLRVGGGCATECEVLFNLDGGGSTQMGFRNPKTKKFRILGMSDEMAPSCDVLRPVDHYFAIVSK
jgi:hypothetical protein